ncbi:S41 family peptidase [Spirosoma jeollabukense]
MPIYILTYHCTFSGAEDFAYGMQVAKRAIIVGERTGGGAHPTKPVSIG